MNAKYSKIWKLTEGWRLLYGAAIGALVLSSCFQYLVPLVPQIILDGVLARDPAKASKLVRFVVEHAGGREFLRSHLWIAAVAVLVLTGLAGLFAYGKGRWSALASEGIARQVREALYRRLQDLPCSYHDGTETGDQVQRCTSDVETLRQFFATQVVEIGRALLMLLVPLPLMLALDRRMTLVSVAVIPPIVLFSLIFFRRVRASFQKVDEAEGRLTSVVQENLTGIRVVRAFARQDFEMEKLEARNAVHRDLDYRLYKLMGGFWSLSDFLCMGQKALVVGFGGYALAAGRLQVGTFFFFLAAVSLFVWPIRQMGRILTELGKATVSMGRIQEILESRSEHAPVSEAGASSGDGASNGDGAEAAASVGPLRPFIPGKKPAVRGRQVRGARVEFREVSFSHNGTGKVLDRISFELRPGETLGLLGASGSGKSTIANLLLRFYDPQEGEIRIDGEDIRRLDRREVRSRISVVMQEPFLYSKTVHENIALGRPGAGPEDVIGSAVEADVHGAVLEFEEGYQTLVGERGVTLSGGQRQRVALARALLGTRDILILDDALSAVDTETEANILAALCARCGRRTTILVAHRLSTLMHADRILVLDHGRVIQSGTHGELVSRPGVYRRLWQAQSEPEEERQDVTV